MATNIIQSGQIIEYTNTGSAISAGDPVLIGNLLGVALTDIAASTGVGSVQISGCVVKDVAKETASTLNQGQGALYWQTAEKISENSTSATLTYNAFAAESAGTAVETVDIILK